MRLVPDLDNLYILRMPVIHFKNLLYMFFPLKTKFFGTSMVNDFESVWFFWCSYQVSIRYLVGVKYEEINMELVPDAPIPEE